MNKTELQKTLGFSEVKLDSLLNEVGLLPQFKHLEINAYSTEIPKEVEDYIKKTVKPSAKALQASSAKTVAPSELEEDDPQAMSEIKSMSIDEAALDLMDAEDLAHGVTSAIDQQRQTYQTNKENARSMRAGIVDEGLIQRRIEGETVAELEAYEYLDAYHDRFQGILEDYSDYRHVSHNQFLQGIARKGSARNSDRAEARAKKLAERAEQYKQVSQAIEGKFPG